MKTWWVMRGGGPDTVDPHVRINRSNLLKNKALLITNSHMQYVSVRIGAHTCSETRFFG